MSPPSCQTGRWFGVKKHVTASEPPCPGQPEDGQTYCAECRAKALSRLPDRSIGDARAQALRWPGAYTPTGRKAGAP